MRKKWVICGAVLLCLLAVFLLWGNTVKESFTAAIEEDFRITDSLGKAFFIEEEPPAVAASSGGVTVEACLASPSKGAMHSCVFEREVCAAVECKGFAAALATGDGVITDCGGGSVTLTHTDGRISVYLGVTELVRRGQRVAQGDPVGYAQKGFFYKLYSGGTAVDPLLYVQQ